MLKTTVRLVYRYEGKYKPFCSGGSIGPNEALSGGHCFNGSKVREALETGGVFVEYYDPRKSGKVTRVQVDSIERRQDEKGDVAYLRTRGKAPNDQSIPMAYGGCDAGSPYFVAGFGLDEKDALPNYAKYSTYQEASAEERDAVGKSNVESKLKNPRSEDWLILKAQVGRTCAGDSGGLVYCKSKGKLAIAGISTAIWSDKLQNTDVSLSDVGSCRRSPFMSAGKISSVLSDIETWRNSPPGGSAPADGNR